MLFDEFYVKDHTYKKAKRDMDAINRPGPAERLAGGPPMVGSSLLREAEIRAQQKRDSARWQLDRQEQERQIKLGRKHSL